MITTRQSIGDLTFVNNPNIQTPPEAKKITAAVATYKSSAVFQWEAILSGTLVELTWDWMYEWEYQLLRTMALTTGQYEWDTTHNDVLFNVIVYSPNGTYLKNAIANSPFRQNVSCTLNIRSQV